MLDRKSQKIFLNIGRHSEAARKGAMKGLWDAGKFAQKEIKERIKDKSEKTGRIYRYKGRTHQASAPGEYPANRSGTTRKGVGFEVHSSDALEIGYRSQVKWGKFLEEGTRIMKPRPALDRTVQKNKVKMANIIGREIYKEIIK